jgi:8-oxo-dGTP diphosphatase/2-hydroxy-dATP diphosphatase
MIRTKVLTLCFIMQDNKMLLGMKKRGFGQGKWNGFGGKLQAGESVEDAVRREVMEEAGLNIITMEKKGFVRFEFADGSDTHDGHIFECTKFEGQPMETEEMKPQWFSKDALPYTDMWPGDLHWLPTFLAGKKFRGRFVYDKPSTSDHETQIIEQQLETVSEI